MNSVNKYLDISSSVNSCYNSFIILDPTCLNKDNLDNLLEECLSFVRKYKIEDLYLSNCDRSFIDIIIATKLINNSKDIKEISFNVYLIFSVMKYLSINYPEDYKSIKNFKRLCESTLEFSEKSGLSHGYYYEINYIIKLISCSNPKPDKILSTIENSKFIRPIGQTILDLYSLIRSSSGEYRKMFIHEIKSIDFSRCLQAMFSMSSKVSFDRLFTIEVNSNVFDGLFNFWLTKLLIQNGYFNVDYKLSIIEEDVDTNDYTEDNRILKEKIKENRRRIHKEMSNCNLFNDTSEDCISDSCDDIIGSEINMCDNVSEVNFTIPFSDKKSILDGYNLVILKSKDIDIRLDLENSKIYNIDNVPQEVFNDSVDSVIIAVKGVSHSDVFRIKSFAKGLNIVYTSRINDKLIIEDIFNRV